MDDSPNEPKEQDVEVLDYLPPKKKRTWEEKMTYVPGPTGRGGNKRWPRP